MDNNKVVGNKEVLSTTDYSVFKELPGNRIVDKKHVKQLQKLMLLNGNLTYEFPIVVSSEGFVIDGQHRLAALQELGWEVGYVVESTATIETVRAINQGNRNWSWRDMAESYANLGDDNYKWFLSFVDTYDLNFSPALAVVNNTVGSAGKQDSNWSKFRNGQFQVHDKKAAHDRAIRINELLDCVDAYSNDLYYAMLTVTKSPAYAHDRMKQKLKALADRVPERARKLEYTRVLEDIYNHGYPDDGKVRLF